MNIKEQFQDKEEISQINTEKCKEREKKEKFKRSSEMTIKEERKGRLR
jgi:hypothetical protein